MTEKLSGHLLALEIVIWIAAAGLLVAVYWPGLHGSFFFDDQPNILLAEGVKLESFSIDGLRQALTSRSAGLSARPLSQLSFALNYYFCGFNPFTFKVTNLVIHGLNGILVFLLAFELIGASHGQQPRNQLRAMAGVVAGIWLLSPIQLTPVLFVVQRMTSLAALFTLSGLLLHIRGRRKDHPWRNTAVLFFAWGVAWPLAWFSKETAALFPAFVATWEILIRRKVHGGLDMFGKLYCGLALISVLAILVYLSTPAGTWLWAGYSFRPFTAGQRLLTESRVLWDYLGMILTPQISAFTLHHDDIPFSTDWLTPWTTVPAMVGLAGLAGMVWWGRNQAPLASFGIAWFLIGHSLESSFLPLEIAYEHRNYLPIFGICMVLADVLLRLAVRPGASRTAAVTLTAAILVYFSFVTAMRAQIYSDETFRTQMETQYHPDSPRANYEAGLALTRSLGKGQGNLPAFSMARASFSRATKLDKNDKFGLLGLLYLDCRAGLAGDGKSVDELAKRLRLTPFSPGDSTAMYSLKDMSIAGTVCLARADVDRLFSAALENTGISPRTRIILYSWHADYLWLGAHDVPAAKQALSQSLALAPDNPSNRLKWTQLLLLSGDIKGARETLQALSRNHYYGEERQTISALSAALFPTGHFSPP
jgi:hypothetical protein